NPTANHPHPPTFPTRRSSDLDASLNITVRATSLDGSTADQTFTVAINDVNEFAVTTPVDRNATANAVAENAAVGTVVGVTAFARSEEHTTELQSHGHNECRLR